MTGKIGIICASDTELEPFLGHIQNKAVTEKAMLKFYEGNIGTTSVVAVYSGVCKVNAAITAQLLVDVFHVDAVINAGTAGGMDKTVRIFDTVVSEQVAYHDVADDVLTEFHPWLSSSRFLADDAMLALVRDYSKTAKHPILFGKTVTGEQFITDDKRVDINQKFNPLSVDMETAAIAHVCYVNHAPFLAVRTITDTAEHIGVENFEKNCEIASRISAEVVMELLARMG